MPMKHSLIASALLVMLLSAVGFAQDPTQKATSATTHARGTFDVKITPLADDGVDPALKRMAIDKQIHGDIDGVSKGEMLTASTDVKNSAVYVAIERVSGTLNGHKGTFLLHHTAIMERGKPSLSITVVPDSGTGELTGLTGTMNIIIAPDGKHSYDFEYSLPSSTK